MHPNKPLKNLFNKNNAWLTYLGLNIGLVRDAVIENVTKMLAAVQQHSALESMPVQTTIALTPNTSIKPVNQEPVIAVAQRPQSVGCKPNNMYYQIVNGNISPSLCLIPFGKYSAIVVRC